MNTSFIKTLSVFVIIIIGSEAFAQNLKMETQFFFDAQDNETAILKDDILIQNKLKGLVFSISLWNDKMVVACRSEKSNNLSQYIKDSEVIVHILDMEGTILNSFTVSNPNKTGIWLSPIGVIDNGYNDAMTAVVDDFGNIFIAFRGHEDDHEGVSEGEHDGHLFKYSSDGKELWRKTFDSKDLVQGSRVTLLKPLKKGCVVIRNNMIEIYNESETPVKQIKMRGAHAANVYVKDREKVFYRSLEGNAKNGYTMEVEDLIQNKKTIIEIGNHKIENLRFIFDNDENIVMYYQFEEKRIGEGDKKPKKYYDGGIKLFTSSGQLISDHTMFSNLADKETPPVLISVTGDKIIGYSDSKFLIGDFDFQNSYSELSISSDKNLQPMWHNTEFINDQKFMFKRRWIYYDYQIAFVKYSYK